MSKHLEKLKDIELFEGKTLDEIFQVIYDMSIEQQKEAMSAFKKLNEFVQDTEDAFMLGDKGAPYLDNAHLLIFYQFWIVKESLPADLLTMTMMKSLKIQR